MRWYGQSAFALTDGADRVFVDPFGDMSAARGRGMTWSYPAIAGAAADLLLVTHEHGDHNAVDVIAEVKHTVRSSAGTFETPVGRVIGIASEHDDVAGTKRGANVIYVFQLDGMRVCHMGDFGQAELRPAQREAIGEIDFLFVPVGGTATIDGPAAARLVAELNPSWVVPMHYRTPAISFLETAETFLDKVAGEIVTLSASDFDTDGMNPDGDRLIVVPAPPLP
ncbi:MAG TPA: MBL fold metallo-hydrolase [Candidatus Dormibacteraeota bacterium]|nr:MBL fold metallo-hydrolase [Candidatus Dormibacteraeota bacterium]